MTSIIDLCNAMISQEEIGEKYVTFETIIKKFQKLVETINIIMYLVVDTGNRLLLLVCGICLFKRSQVSAMIIAVGFIMISDTQWLTNTNERLICHLDKPSDMTE